MAAVERVYVHIGPPKTGTTYLQAVLRRNQTALADEGIVLPRQDRQHRAALSLMDRAPPQLRDAGPARRYDGWDRWLSALSALSRPDARTAVLSAEGLCRARAHHVAELVGSLAPAEVHVVYAARDLARQVTAEWQTLLRNQESPTWEEWLSSLREPGGPDTYGWVFWERQDPRRTLPVWLEHVPGRQVHVLVVPPPGSDPSLLWRRFAGVIGVDADRYDLDVPRTNLSLGGVEAEVLRRLTARVGPLLRRPVYRDIVRQFVAREVLEPREQSFRLVLPEAEHSWVEQHAHAIAAYLRDAELPVVGDLDELTPVRRTGTRQPDDVSVSEILALTDQLLAATVLEMARRGGRDERGLQDGVEPTRRR